MRIRMKMEVLGSFEGRDQGVKRGDIIDVSEVSAKRYVASRYAEYVESKSEPPVERATAPEGETATLKAPGPKPLDEPEDEEPASTKKPAARRVPAKHVAPSK